MIRITDTAIDAILKDSEQCVAPSMGDVQLMVFEIRQLKAVNFDYFLGKQAQDEEITLLKVEVEALRKALIAIRDNSISLWSCETAADALVDSRK